MSRLVAWGFVVTPSSLLYLSLLRWVFAGVRAAGATDEDLARETGWTGTDEPDARVPCATAVALIDGAIRVTNDPLFGLHTARAIRLGELGAPLACCCGVGRPASDVLHQAERYLGLHGSAMRLRTERTDTGSVIDLVFSPPSLDRSARAATEFALGALSLALREASGQPGIVRSVQFRHAAPPSRDEYEQLFSCPLKFGASSYQLEIGNEAPVRRGAITPPLPASVAEHVQRALSGLPAVGPKSSEVRQFLAGRFPWGIPSMTQTAQGVSESVQSLYDKLVPEGAAFARLREELLSELACAYMRNSTLSTPEVAYLLGFVEMAVFEQSFTRWTGASAAEYRAKHPQG